MCSIKICAHLFYLPASLKHEENGQSIVGFLWVHIVGITVRQLQPGCTWIRWSSKDAHRKEPFDGFHLTDRPRFQTEIGSTKYYIYLMSIVL